MPDFPTSDPAQFYQGAPLLMVPDVSATDHPSRAERSHMAYLEGNPNEIHELAR